MSTPLVSIVIPSYNYKHFIADAIDSCLAQTYPNYEIIVVDDGSSDGTADYLREQYGDRVCCIVHEQNQGLSAARNTGINAAHGELLQFLDADDQLLPEKLARSVEALNQHPKAVLVYTQCDHVEADGRTRIPRDYLDLPSGDLLCTLFTEWNYITVSTVMVRRQAVIEAGSFDVSLRAVEDLDCWLRMASRGPFVALNEMHALYRQQAGAMHKDPLRMAQGRLAVVRKARHYSGREDCLDDAAYDRFEASRYHVLAMVYWAQGQRSEARSAFRTAIWLAPADSNVRRLYLLLSYILPAQLMNWIEREALRLTRKSQA